MGDKTIRAINEIEREKNYTPQEALEFLQNEEHFRSVSSGIKRELHRLGYGGDDKQLLKAFRGLMLEKCLISAEGKLEARWLNENKLPTKEQAIKLCFAFGLSSQKDKANPEAVTATEFLWNVCCVNGFNYRCAEDIIFNYALECGKDYKYAKGLISRYEAETIGITYDESDNETKGTSMLWRIFKNLSGMKETVFLTKMKDNAEHFYCYNKTSKKEFVDLYETLLCLLEDMVRKENSYLTYAYVGYKKQQEYLYHSDSRRQTINTEKLFKDFADSIFNKATKDKPTNVNAVLENILNGFPVQSTIDKMKSTAKDNRNVNTDSDFNHGAARKAFILCFFLKYFIKWELFLLNNLDKPMPKGMYKTFYRTLEVKLLRCSYGSLYPANPFDWLILNCARFLETWAADMDALELFNKSLALLEQEQA